MCYINYFVPLPIRHLQPPTPPPQKFWKTFVSHFSWLLQLSQEKLKTILMQFFFWGGGGGQKRCIMGDPQIIANTQNAPQDAIIAFLYLSCNKPLEKEFCSVNLPSKQPLSLHMHQKTFKKSQPQSHQPVWKCLKGTTGCTLKPRQKKKTTTRHNILPLSRDNQNWTVTLHSYLYLTFFSVSCDS